MQAIMNFKTINFVINSKNIAKNINILCPMDDLLENCKITIRKDFHF